MKANVSLGGTGVLAIVAVAAVGYVAWKALPKVAAVANAVSPLNHDNVFATGVNAAGGAIVTDPAGIGKNADGSWSLGGAVADIVTGANDKIKDMLKPTAAPVFPSTANAGAQLADESNLWSEQDPRAWGFF